MVEAWTGISTRQVARLGGDRGPGKGRRRHDLIGQRRLVAHGLTFRLDDGDGLDQVKPTGQSAPAILRIIETSLGGVKQNLPHVLTATAVALRPGEAQE